MAVATTLLCDKMEQFRSAAFNDAIWTNSSGSENLVVEGDRYIRTWQLGSNTPRMVTVAIYAQRNTLAGRQVQLVRATTLVSPTF
jgi:hypothetical protein